MAGSRGAIGRQRQEAEALGSDDVIDDIVTTAGGVSRRLLKSGVYVAVSSPSPKHPHQIDPRVASVCFLTYRALQTVRL